MLEVDFCPPFLRWVGGKRRMLQDLSKLLSPTGAPLKGRYIEPFLGGGAFLLNVRAHSRIGADINHLLMTSYRVVRDDVLTLKAKLSPFLSDKDFYRKVSLSVPRSDSGKAARFIYLNKHAFGGVYRENRSGIYNVPFGGERGFVRITKGRLLAYCSERLQGVDLYCGDFEETISMAVRGDSIFCDPVYRVDEHTRVFDRYNRSSFTWADLERLVRIARDCEKRGVCTLITLPESKSIRALMGRSPVALLDRSGAFGIEGGYYHELVFRFGKPAI
jgi:DNA adenine methylase